MSEKRSKPPQTTRKRTKIDLKMKLKIIELYENGKGASSIAREYGLSSSTISTILKDSSRIKEHIQTSVSLKSTIISKRRSGAFSEMEKLLSIWMKDQIHKGFQLSVTAIQAKARSLYTDIKDRYPNSSQTFLASKGWFNRFKIRAGFLDVKIFGEAASYDDKAAQMFPNILKEIIDEGCYIPEQIFNIKEMELFWKKLPERIISSKEEIDRLTLLLGSNASGTLKLKPLLIYKKEKPPGSLEGIAKKLLPLYYRSSRQAWITIPLFEDWFTNCFIPEVEEYCRENNIPFKILVILDNSPGHPNYLDYIHLDVKVTFLPPNTISLIQPMEQGIISNFKLNYLLSFFETAALKSSQKTHNSFQIFWKTYNLHEAIINITKAWKDVPQSCLNGAWKKICPQFVLDEAKDPNESYEEIAEKICQIADQLQLELDMNDIDEFLESHGKELSNEELIELESGRINDRSKPEPVLDPDAEGRKFIPEEMEIAFNEISSGLSRLEKMDPNPKRFRKVQTGIYELLGVYKHVYKDKMKEIAKSGTPETSTSRSPVEIFPIPSTSAETSGFDINPLDYLMIVTKSPSPS